MTVVDPVRTTGGVVQPAAGRLVPLSGEELRLTGGFWADRQQLNADVVLDHCRRWMDRIGWIGNFDAAAAGTVATVRAGVEFVDSEVYKLIEAMAWELGRRPTPDLEQQYTDLVARVVAAQEPDGYLHTAFGRRGQRPRFSDLEWGHELYCFGHLFQAAVARLRTGWDDALPAAARRLADLVDLEFGQHGRDAVCGHPEIEMGLVELGRATGEQRYVDLAKRFIDRRGRRTLKTDLFHGSDYFLDDEPVRDADVLRGHAVRAVYLGAGAVDAAVETGDDELARAVQRQWTATTARRTYLTGGMGAHHQNEAFGDDFELPADRAYAETCAAIGSVMLAWRLQLLTGETKYADLIERTLFNAVLVGPSEDGRAFFYANTLHQREPGEPRAADELSQQAEATARAPWFEVSCCPTNVARTLASLSGYFATRDDGGVQLHQYGGLEVRTTVGGGTPVDLDVETDYPHSGRIVVRVRTAASFALTLRVPPWAGREAQVATRHRVDRRAGAFVVDGDFARGDEVVLQLPMTTRVTAADPRVDAVRGTVAFERGPQVLCLESPDLPADVDLNAVTVDPWSVPDRGEPTVVLSTGSPGESAWPYGTPVAGSAARAIEAVLRPYAGWGNRGPATMRVWIPIGDRS